MSTENVVLEVAVTHEGEEYKATYFLENGIIHANVEGRTMRLPHGRAPVEETVKAVLIGALDRKRRQMDRMRGLEA